MLWQGPLLESRLQPVFRSLKAVLQRTFQTGRGIVAFPRPLDVVELSRSGASRRVAETPESSQHTAAYDHIRADREKSAPGPTTANRTDLSLDDLPFLVRSPRMGRPTHR